MKPYSNKNNGENPAILVTAYFEEPNMLQLLVEKLAECNCGFGYSQRAQPDYQTIETSSLEAFVSGRIILSMEDNLIDIPFVSSFLFTCMKAAKNQYKLTWSCCLS